MGTLTVDASPDVSRPLSYCSFFNEGLGRNNAYIEHEDRDAWVKVVDTVRHAEEFYCGYGYPYWDGRRSDLPSAFMVEVDEYYAEVTGRVSPLRGRASLYALRGSASYIAMLASPEDLNEILPVALVSPVPAPVQWYYDNATSVSITPHLSQLTHVVRLQRPFTLGGIGSGILVTHRGALGLPSGASLFVLLLC